MNRFWLTLKGRGKFRAIVSALLMGGFVLGVNPSLVAGAPPFQAGAQPRVVEDKGAIKNISGEEESGANWLESVQKDLRQREYNLTWQEQTSLPGVKAAYQAPNRANNLRTFFTPQGTWITPVLLAGMV